MIMSGLKPEIVMDVCGRALSFWVYQIYQEQCYQDIMLRNQDEKRQVSERQFHAMMSQAKAELSGMVRSHMLFFFIV